MSKLTQFDNNDFIIENDHARISQHLVSSLIGISQPAISKKLDNLYDNKTVEIICNKGFDGDNLNILLGYYAQPSQYVSKETNQKCIDLLLRSSSKGLQMWIDEFAGLKQKQSLPQTYKEALLALIEEIDAKEKLEAEKQLLEQENEQLAEAVDELFEYSSIIRVAKFNNCSEKAFSWRKLKAASIAMKLEIKRVPCPRFETKLLYSHDAWRYVYPEYKLPETTTVVIKN